MSPCIDDRFVEPHSTGGAMEDGISEGEDSSVSSDQPVPVPARRGHDGQNRCVQAQLSETAVGPCRSEWIDLTCARDHPVAVTAGPSGHAHDVPWLRRLGTCGRALGDVVAADVVARAGEWCVSEGEHATIRRRQPVALTRGCGFYGDDWMMLDRGAEVPEELGAGRCSYFARRIHGPKATAVRVGGDVTPGGAEPPQWTPCPGRPEPVELLHSSQSSSRPEDSPGRRGWSRASMA